MPELTEYESGYWDGWDDAAKSGDSYAVESDRRPDDDENERGYWDGWNAKIAQLQFAQLVS